MNCEIITIGSELLLGHVRDTNAAYLSRALSLIGIDVAFHTKVGDNYTHIRDVLSQAVKRADLVITTGGLGPTEDDLTREAIADLVGVSLRFKEELMDQITSVFRSAGYRMPENNRKQALIPDGAIPVSNDIGTAPAFMVEKGSSLIVALPGVPREVNHILNRKIIPCLKEHFRLDKQVIISRVLKVAGMGESTVDSRIKDLIDATANPSVGILASLGDISVRITAHGGSAKEAQDLIRPLEREMRSRLGINIYGVNDDTLDAVVIHLLNQGGDTVSVVETFSGGELTARLQRSPSSPLRKGLVIGKGEEVSSFLGIRGPLTSRETAEALARKIRDEGKSSIGLALYGTLDQAERGYEVHAQVAVSHRDINRGYEWSMGGDIPTLQSRAATTALNSLRLALTSP